MTLAIQQPDQFNKDQIDLIKNTVAKGTTDLQLQLFLEVCKTSGLNPFQRQIYAVMRESWNPDTKRKEPTMTIQTGIDGYRVIAARTGVHAGTTDPEYGPLEGKYPTWARVVVRKIVGGVLAEFPATARWSEYVQTNREGAPTNMWAKMPFLMLGKCAEALALRKAFPAELSGVYTDTEMMQAGEPLQATEAPPRAPQATPEPIKATELKFISADAAGRLRAQLTKLGITNAEQYANAELAFDATGKPLEKLTELTTDDAKQLYTIATTQPIGKAEGHHLHGILSAMLKNAGVTQKDKDWASSTLGKAVGSFAELTRPERMQLLNAAESLQEQSA